jgi:O-antigen/teichoic acid export membrane protein
MTFIKKNIAANFVGNFWQVLMNVVFVPLYIKFMGVEAYGLIGIFTTLQGMLAILDAGLSSTLNREMARLSALPGKEQDMRNTVRTLETIYWCLSIFIGLGVMVLSPFVAHHWINVGKLPPETIEHSVLIMGFVVSLQMIAGFYSGGLMGLQRQVLLSAVNVIMGTLRGVGAVLLLWLVSSSIQAFFIWQIAISFIHTLLLALFLWRELPGQRNPATFQRRLLTGIWRFTAGISGITILGAIVAQLDKIILSKMLSLEMFGYYTVASVVAMSLGRLTSPIFFGTYPRLTQLVSLNDQEGLIRLYHKSCQLMSVMILPAAIVVAMFSNEILLLWMHDAATAEKSHLLVTILVCGTALNGLMGLPYALQLAYGWTSLCLIKCIIMVLLMAPLTIFMTIHGGAIGAASVWLFINLCDILLSIPVMHWRLLRSEKWRWYRQDVGIPLATGLIIAGLGRAFIGGAMSQFMMWLSIILISVITFGITATMTPAVRTWLSDWQV